MTPGLSSAADIHSDAASSSPSCWKCGNTIHPSDEIFFCKCGVIMAPRPNMDHFQLFNLEKSFNLNEESLSQKFKDLQRQLHPDKFTQKSETEQQYSADQSSQVNKAYTTLIKPLSRGLYLLELSGDPIDETTDNTNLDPDFLMEIMEINEDLAETDSMEKVNAIRKRNQQVLQRLTTDISMAFDKGDISEARKLLIHLKYYDNIAGKIKELERKEFED
ncbi:iron-sulfur cluster co-chaperone protein HscB-like [Liolophura sinensis]|uniref:iron-sulfur cluster co-chaperone protein HscB-like n=1 Tax=Liolophura sinensis TaxID=3198878 RepID=UPI0031585824